MYLSQCVTTSSSSIHSVNRSCTCTERPSCRKRLVQTTTIITSSCGLHFLPQHKTEYVGLQWWTLIHPSIAYIPLYHRNMGNCSNESNWCPSSIPLNHTFLFSFHTHSPLDPLCATNRAWWREESFTTHLINLYRYIILFSFLAFSQKTWNQCDVKLMGIMLFTPFQQWWDVCKACSLHNLIYNA